MEKCKTERCHQEEHSVHQQTDINLRNKLVKCYIGNIALVGAETWTLQKVDHITWKVLKCGVGEGCRRSSGLIM